ncbi:pilus assembly protein PilY [Dyella solisilvae]|uniref:Pilus assembly protein PilY n=1 Tax=Dyella solisilvae TaxID=1920168 RepID=A0A370KBN2_9GAMM|nr:PilC/PilY family type IV pilus protein [Dyella solisilvae]RDJ00064.1 pilus assembly protein PilY [Dyella solisilvae]
MNTKPQAPRRKGSAAIRALGTMLVVWMLGAIYMPALAAVTVDQQPLTVQPTIPPNIVLMLDDSGSMAWDYMPDWGYLTSSTGNGSPSNDQARNSAINGAYYNPAITYSLPPKADSTAAVPDLYPASPGLTNAYKDGFTDTTATDITSFTGGFPYYQTYTVTGTYTATATTTYSCPSGYSLRGSNCKQGSTSIPATATTTYSCNGTDPLSGTTCTGQISQNYFTYTTGSGNTENYVGATGTCAWLSTATPKVGSTSQCDDTAATQQNVANWFSYYRTRIQMAKSGLMTAFSTVDKGFRVGFGSIDGGCNHDADNIKAPTSSSSAPAPYTYTDTFDCGNGGSVTNKVAAVQPFGDGSSGKDQKNVFWTWAAALSPSGGTPLRMALSQIGQYYQTSQPWTTMSSDPGYGTTSQPSYIACRQAYTILTTDGFWNETYSSSTISGASNAVWPTISGPNGQSWPTTANSKPAAPYSGGVTSSEGPSLADVALYYWENDLQPSTNFPNEVPTNKEDPAFWQHMVTFTMGLGFTPTGISGSATIGTTTDTPPTISDIFSVANGTGTLTSFKWPTPSGKNNGSIYNISDLAHAGVNGHGGFYSATSPSAFASGLTDALNRAASRSGSGASLAANSTQLTNGTVAYQAKYETVQWTGDLLALSINSSTGAISSTASWSAASMLVGSATVTVNGKYTIDTYPSRTIWTYVPGTAAAGSFVKFIDSGTGSSATPPALSTTQLAALGSSTTAQAAMVNYLRGDNTSEQVNSGTFRTRSTPLGDIVDSQPVYSGAPNPNEFENQVFVGTSNTATTGNNSFQAFAVGTTSGTTTTASAASTRTALVFVAANDGMLHAFNASTGAETYAYLPGAVITAGLKNLSDPTYGSVATTTVTHQYYNDGELTIADVYFNSNWHTVLVGTTGRGTAKAVYALDITDPNNITPLWERSAGDGQTNSNYIGQMVGKPVIAKVQDGTDNSDWQVLIGNGYNSNSGTAALLEFNVATGALSVHTTDATASNGLAAPVTWMDNPANGTSTEAYAGDLAGRVWMFPLVDVTTTTTGSGATQTTKTTSTGDFTKAGTKEFTATDPSGVAQPITSGMLAGRDPITGNVWVFFGTGEYLTSGDTTNKQVQSWYGVIMQAGKNSGTLPSLPATTLDGSLVERYVIYEQDGNTSATPPTLGVRAVTTLPVPSDMPGKLGWYMNLEQPTTDSKGNVAGYNAQGERMVTPNQFQGNLLLGTTRIPTAASNADICNSSGSGWVMAVDPFTGTNPSGNFFMVNGSAGSVTLPNGTVVAAAGVGFSSLPNNPIFVGGDMLMSFDNGSTSSLNTSGASGMPQRVSWQELVNP